MNQESGIKKQEFKKRHNSIFIIHNSCKSTGFTLIELLVVVSLIGVLATLVLANLNAARQRGRDSARKSDIRNIQTALRLYYNDYSGYPASDSSYNILGCGALGTAVCVWGGVWSAGAATTYMTVLPKDALPDQSYRYQGVAGSESYTLAACLENKSDDKGVVTADTAWCPTGWMYQVQP